MLVLVKVSALIALGLFGAAQRRFLIWRMQRPTSAHGAPADASIARDFWVLVVVELAFMGLASGVAAALARTATPVSEDAAGSLARTPAEILTGQPLPPWPEWTRYFTEWNPDLLWLLACGFGIFFYLAGVRRLRKRGDHWPSTARCSGWPACCCSPTSRAAA